MVKLLQIAIFSEESWSSLYVNITKRQDAVNPRNIYILLFSQLVSVRTSVNINGSVLKAVFLFVVIVT